MTVRYESPSELVESMVPTAFVISLHRSRQRRRHVQRLIKSCPVPCQRLDAVDGYRLDEEEIAEVYRPKRHRPHYPFELSPGEIGCFLSHRRVWQKMVDELISSALVLEDDIELRPAFAAALRLASEMADEGTYVRFQDRPKPVHGEILRVDGEFVVIKPAVIPLGATAQLVTLQAAEKLLRRSETFDRPVDTFVQMRWLHEVEVLHVSPQCVAESSEQLGGSTIQHKRGGSSVIDTLVRHYNRSTYRRRITALAKRAA